MPKTIEKYAICPLCKKEMKPGTPCKYTHIVHNGKVYFRDTIGFGSDICHDCNAPLNKPHHYGCDAERCPVCGGQFIGCGCFEDGVTMEFIRYTASTSSNKEGDDGR